MPRHPSPDTSVDPLRPWPPYKFVPAWPDAAEYLGVTRAWMKRARQDGFIEFVRLRGVLVVRAAELYRLVAENTERANAKRRPITRARTAEHNARIAAGVRAAHAKRSRS